MTDREFAHDTVSYEYMFVCSICNKVSAKSVCENDHSSFMPTQNTPISSRSGNIDYEYLINSSTVIATTQGYTHDESLKKKPKLEINVLTKIEPSKRPPELLSTSTQQTFVCPECGKLSKNLQCTNNHTVNIPKDVCDQCNVSFESVEELLKHKDDTTSCNPPVRHYFIPFRNVKLVSLPDSKQVFYDMGEPIVLNLPENFAGLVAKGSLGLGQYQIATGYPIIESGDSSYTKKDLPDRRDEKTDVPYFDWKNPSPENSAPDQNLTAKKVLKPETLTPSETKNEPNKPTLKELPRSYPRCVVCKLDFLSVDSLITHAVSHGEPLDFQCQFCSRHYNRAYWFKAHLSSHFKQLPLFCQLCEDSFLSADKHKEHLRNVHNLDDTHMQLLLDSNFSDHKNQFICIECGRWLKSELHLKCHLQVHQMARDTKQTSCKKQDKTSTNANPAASATTTNNQIKAEHKKPIHVFECNICSATIRSIDEVRLHLSQHARNRLYKCEACRERFSSPQQLQDHKCNAATSSSLDVQSRRSQEHRCAQCGIVFNHAAGLAYHSKIHSDDGGSDGWSCEKCSLKFKILSSYLIHRAQAH